MWINKNLPHSFEYTYNEYDIFYFHIVFKLKEAIDTLTTQDIWKFVSI